MKIRIIAYRVLIERIIDSKIIDWQNKNDKEEENVGNKAIEEERAR